MSHPPKNSLTSPVLQNSDEADLDWIRSIESASARVREADLYPLLRNWLIESGARTVAEIGSGQGACSSALDLTACSYVGIEPSAILRSRAAELYADANRSFVHGSAESIPAPDHALDAAFSVSVWHLLSDLGAPARELARVLKAGGRFLVILANPAAELDWLSLYSDVTRVGSRVEGLATREGKPPLLEVIYLHPVADLRSALGAAKLEVESVSTFRESKSAGRPQLFLCVSGRRAEL